MVGVDDNDYTKLRLEGMLREYGILGYESNTFWR